MRTKKFLSLLLSAAMAFSLLTATAFAAAPAEEENGIFDFLFLRHLLCLPSEQCACKFSRIKFLQIVNPFPDPNIAYRDL